MEVTIFKGKNRKWFHCWIDLESFHLLASYFTIPIPMYLYSVQCNGTYVIISSIITEIDCIYSNNQSSCKMYYNIYSITYNKRNAICILWKYLQYICFGKISIMIAKENEQNRPASAVNLLKSGTYLKISMYILCTY